MQLLIDPQGHGFKACGLMMACVTRLSVVPQAYGARNYGALGVVLQQAVVISTAVFLLILALWTQVHHLLLAAGVPAMHFALLATLCFIIKGYNFLSLPLRV